MTTENCTTQDNPDSAMAGALITGNPYITIDRKQLAATIKEVTGCSYIIADTITLCENNLDADGRLECNEPTSGVIAMLLSVAARANAKQLELMDHLGGVAGVLPTEGDSTLGMFEFPTNGEPFYIDHEDENHG